MKITTEIKKKAAAIIEKRSPKTLFVNDKGEFFTVECNAANSVGGDKERYTDVSSVSVSTSPDGSQTAAELIAIVKAAETVEAVQAILDAENEKQVSEIRKTVVAACEKKIEELTKDTE